MPDLVKKAEVVITGNAVSANRALESVGRGLVAAAGAVIAFYAGAASQQMEWENNLGKISTAITDKTTSIGQLGSAISDLSTKYGRAANELAQAEYELLSGGVSGPESQEFLAQAAKASVAGWTDVATAVDGATTIYNAWGKEAATSQQIFDAMFSSVQVGKMEFADLAHNVGMFANQAANMGVPINDALGALSAMTLRGLNASRASEYLRGVLNSILTPTTQAKKAAREYGIELSGAGMKAEGFANYMKHIYSATGGSADALGKIFSNTEALNGALALVGRDGGAAFEQTLSTVRNSLGATDNAFSKMSDTPGFKYDKLKQGLAQSVRDVGDVALGKAEKLTGLVSGLSTAIHELSQTSSGNTIISLGLDAGMASLGVGALAMALPGIKTGAATALTAAAALGKFLLTPWGFAIAAAALAIGLLIKKYFDWKDAVENIDETLKRLPPELGGYKGLPGNGELLSPQSEAIREQMKQLKQRQDELRVQRGEAQAELTDVKNAITAAHLPGGFDTPGFKKDTWYHGSLNPEGLAATGGIEALEGRLKRARELKQELGGISGNMTQSYDEYNKLKLTLQATMHKFPAQGGGGQWGGNVTDPRASADFAKAFGWMGAVAPTTGTGAAAKASPLARLQEKWDPSVIADLAKQLDDAHSVANAQIAAAGVTDQTVKQAAQTQGDRQRGFERAADGAYGKQLASMETLLRSAQTRQDQQRTVDGAARSSTTAQLAAIGRIGEQRTKADDAELAEQRTRLMRAQLGQFVMQLSPVAVPASQPGSLAGPVGDAAQRTGLTKLSDENLAFVVGKPSTPAMAAKAAEERRRRGGDGAATGAPTGLEGLSLDRLRYLAGQSQTFGDPNAVQAELLRRGAVGPGKRLDPHVSAIGWGVPNASSILGQGTHEMAKRPPVLVVRHEFQDGVVAVDVKAAVSRTMDELSTQQANQAVPGLDSGAGLRPGPSGANPF